MLVLTRKPNQQLHIGNDIVITVVKVRGNTIRLGIEAPKDVRVIRAELGPKPAHESKPLSGSGSDNDSRPSPVAAVSDDPSEAAASADDGQAELVADACVDAAPPVIFEARIKQPAMGRSGLKRFTDIQRVPGAPSQRNLEDSPLCHSVPQEAASALRPCGLHSYLAAKNRSGLLAHDAPRDPHGKSSDGHHQPSQGQHTQSSHVLTVQG